MSKAGKVKPVIKVYLLPKMSEARLQQFYRAMVATALLAFEGFGVKSEKDLLTLFIPDMMEYGLGSEIVVEINLPTNPVVPQMRPHEIAGKFGQTVKRFFKDAFVQSTAHCFDPAEQSWTS